MTIWRGLKSHPVFNLSIHPALIDAGDTEAVGIASKAVRDVFGIADLEHGGLTEEECLSLLFVFLLYIDTLKKNTNPPQTSQPPLEPTHSEASTTNAELESLSMSTAPNCGTPGE